MARLGDTFVLIRNGASIKQAVGAGGIPITRIETIANREVDRNKFGYAGILDIQKYSDYVLRDEDILMSHINSEKHLGKAAIYKKVGKEIIIHGMNLLMLRANPKIVFSKYALYFFETPFFQQQIIKITKKSVNQASFTVTDLKDVEIPLPPLETQKDIAAVLDKLSSLISLHKQQLAKLDELVNARFVEMFGDPVSNSMGWNVSLLKNVTSKIGSGATPKGGRESYPTEGITLIRSMNVHDGYFEYKDLAHLNSNQAEQLSNVEVNKDDVFINITGASVARSCIVPENVIPARVNQHVSIIRCKQSIFKPVFANQQFLNATFKKRLLELGEAGGATRQAITKRQLEELTVIVPPLDMQNLYAAFTQQVNQKKQTIRQSLDQLETLKKSLMQEYFG